MCERNSSFKKHCMNETFIKMSHSCSAFLKDNIFSKDNNLHIGKYFVQMKILSSNEDT